MNEGTWFSKWKDLCLAGERERERVCSSFELAVVTNLYLYL